MKIKYLIVTLLAAMAAVATSCKEEKQEIAEAIEWQAKWIGAPWEGERYLEADEHPTPEFCKQFELPGGVKSAVVHVSGLGMFELQLNGKRVGEDY